MTLRAILITAICAVCTFGERLFPFAVFGKRKVPGVVDYLGKALPLAVMTALVIYCVRNMSFGQAADFVPHIVGVAVTAVLQRLFKNSLLSIVCGTAIYMLLIYFM